MLRSSYHLDSTCIVNVLVGVTTKGSPKKVHDKRFTSHIGGSTGSWINETNTPYVYVDENDVLLFLGEIEAGWTKLVIEAYMYLLTKTMPVSLE